MPEINIFNYKNTKGEKKLGFAVSEATREWSIDNITMDSEEINFLINCTLDEVDEILKLKLK